jgi:hypothetical protein
VQYLTSCRERIRKAIGSFRQVCWRTDRYSKSGSTEYEVTVLVAVLRRSLRCTASETALYSAVPLLSTVTFIMQSTLRVTAENALKSSHCSAVQAYMHFSRCFSSNPKAQMPSFGRAFNELSRVHCTRKNWILTWLWWFHRSMLNNTAVWLLMWLWSVHWSMLQSTDV